MKNNPNKKPPSDPDQRPQRFTQLRAQKRSPCTFNKSNLITHLFARPRGLEVLGAAAARELHALDAEAEGRRARDRLAPDHVAGLGHALEPTFLGARRARIHLHHLLVHVFAQLEQRVE